MNTKPIIKTQPKSVSVAEGGTAVFTVKATSVDSYQWYYRNDANDTWKASSNESAKSASYSVPAKLASSGHQYRCKLTNKIGSVYTNIVTLTVNPKPVITTQPKSVKVAVGDTAAFTVTAHVAV